MQLAEVVGHGVATIKHASMKGWRLVIVQPLTPDHRPDGEPLLAIDSLGASVSSLVIVTNDGAGVREIMGEKKSPVRWMILGICDAASW